MINQLQYLSNLLWYYDYMYIKYALKYQNLKFNKLIVEIMKKPNCNTSNNW